MSPYFLNECYKSCFMHVSLFKFSFDLVIFVQNVITRSSSEMTDFSPIILHACSNVSCRGVRYTGGHD